MLRGDRVRAEALRRRGPRARSLEDLEHDGRLGEPLDPGRRQHLDGARDAGHLGIACVRQSEHRDGERHVGPDRRDDLAWIGWTAPDGPQQPPARFGQGGQALERAERGCQPPAVPGSCARR